MPSLCASCGLELSGDSQLCPHHYHVYGDDWAQGNKAACDFFHRGIQPPKETKTEIPLAEEDQTQFYVAPQLPWWARYIRWQDWERNYAR